MARRTTAFLIFLVSALKLSLVVMATTAGDHNCQPIVAGDTDRIQFALNLEFLEAEFFLNGAIGRGLDSIAPSLARGGPPPIGARKANLEPLVAKIIEEFGYQEVGHLRAIITSRIGGIPRPLLNLSVQNFANVFDNAVGFKLIPPFDPYADTTRYLLASYVIPYVGLVGYVGTIPSLVRATSRSLVASLLGVEAGQDAVIRTLLYERANQTVRPYNLTVAEFTNRISGLRNKLAACGIKDEGILVPLSLGAENRTNSNILSADPNSLSYARTPPEILRIVYGSGSERIPGGFFPNGGGGDIARRYLPRA
ncbi:desiccation-related protein PCC13-62-like [Juglans microcarpa x Juglans regia]|uniref:desiccation-related protein PCC13-62-like n=1 Tax=Juglans microcarpa x Juglans regia TaxID=2249226 RepID=UPI001B7DE368|nr:desiccation-related protein PCC13-62-like [Juglans microcarpa x Juglans regia]